MPFEQAFAVFSAAAEPVSKRYLLFYRNMLNWGFRDRSTYGLGPFDLGKLLLWLFRLLLIICRLSSCFEVTVLSYFCKVVLFAGLLNLLKFFSGAEKINRQLLIGNALLFGINLSNLLLLPLPMFTGWLIDIKGALEKVGKGIRRHYSVWAPQKLLLMYFLSYREIGCLKVFNCSEALDDTLDLSLLDVRRMISSSFERSFFIHNV